MKKGRKSKKSKPAYAGFKKRSNAAKKGWETRRKNQNKAVKELSLYKRIVEKGKSLNWSLRQIASVFHSATKEQKNSAANMMAQLFLDDEGPDREDIQDLADFLNQDVSELYAEMFKAYSKH